MSVVDFAEAAGIPAEKIHTVYRWARGNDVKWRIGHQCWTGLRAIERDRNITPPVTGSFVAVLADGSTLTGCAWGAR